MPHLLQVLVQAYMCQESVHRKRQGIIRSESHLDSEQTETAGPATGNRAKEKTDDFLRLKTGYQ